MKLKKIPEWLRIPYTKTCKCGKEYKILSNRDNDPEYLHEFYFECSCGEYVKFILPVN